MGSILAKFGVNFLAKTASNVVKDQQDRADQQSLGASKANAKAAEKGAQIKERMDEEAEAARASDTAESMRKGDF